MSNVLITGASGFLGKGLLKELMRDQGSQFYFLARSENAVAAIAQAVGDNGARAHYVRGDIMKPACAVDGIPDINEVWHLAASTSFDATQKEFITATNVGGTKHMLELAGRMPHLQKFFYISTAYVCGAADGIVPEAILDDEREWKNIYEETKWRAERCVAESPLAPLARVIRPSIIIGDSRTGDSFGDDKVFYGYVRALSAATLFHFGKRCKYLEYYGSAKPGDYVNVDSRIPGDGDIEKNVVTLDDVVNVCVAVRDAPPGVYNVTNPTPLKMRVATDHIQAALRVKGFHHDPSFTERTQARNHVERAVLKYTQIYWPYGLCKEPHWLSANVERLGVRRVQMTPELFSFLMERFVETHLMPR